MTMTLTQMARKGGKARADKLSPERRTEIARKAGKAPKRPRERSKQGSTKPSASFSKKRKFSNKKYINPPVAIG